MDEFELQDSVEDLERRIGKLQTTLDNFVSSFNSRIQDQMSALIDCINDPVSTDHVRDKDDYIIKLLCNLGYGQACILEIKSRL